MADPKITARDFAPTPAESVAMAGLLAAKPELVDAEQTERLWAEALSHYLLRHDTTEPHRRPAPAAATDEASEVSA